MGRNFISILAVLTLIWLLGLAEMSLAVKGTWMEKADMPTPRSHLSASAVNGTIYAIGGMFAVNFNNTTVLPTVEAYNPLTDTWEEKADMPTARLSFSTAVVNGKIYAIGGTTSGGAWWGRSTVEAYDPETDIWITVADMPTPRMNPKAVAVNGKIYVIGGFPPRWGQNWGLNPLPTVEVYDPVKDAWTTLPDMPTRRASFGIAESNGMIYAIGGTQTGNPWPANSIVEVYNPETATWARGPDMPTSRVGISTGVVDGIIYVIGGSTTTYSNGFATVEAFINKGGSAVSPQGKLVTTWSTVKQER